MNFYWFFSLWIERAQHWEQEHDKQMISCLGGGGVGAEKVIHFFF